MDTLQVFTARQGCLISGSDASCRRTAPPLHISCRVWSSSNYRDLTNFQRKSLCRPIILLCDCKPTFSSFRFQTSLHTFHRSAFRVSASSSSSDAIEVEEGMPIPGTITFRRSATQKHYEYFTDLETLGMGSFSSQQSRDVALAMGVTEAPTSKSTSTPASVSIDVTNKGRDLCLDGIVRTALALRCVSCGVPVAERVFGEFSLLLTEQPVVEPTKARIGVVLGGGTMPDEEEDLDEVLDLDLDDKMHFPKSEKTIDISKYIRDTVHLEIPLQTLCSLKCKGRCIDCGANLNQRTCDCEAKANKDNRRQRWGALEKLKEQLEKEGI